MKNKIKLYGVFSQQKNWCANYTCSNCGSLIDRHYMTIQKTMVTGRVQRHTEPFCNKTCAVNYFKKHQIKLEKWSVT